MLDIISVNIVIYKYKYMYLLILIIKQESVYFSGTFASTMPLTLSQWCMSVLLTLLCLLVGVTQPFCIPVNVDYGVVDLIHVRLKALTYMKTTLMMSLNHCQRVCYCIQNILEY